MQAAKSLGVDLRPALATYPAGSSARVPELRQMLVRTSYPDRSLLLACLGAAAWSKQDWDVYRTRLTKEETYFRLARELHDDFGGAAVFDGLRSHVHAFRLNSALERLPGVVQTAKRYLEMTDGRLVVLACLPDVASVVARELKTYGAIRAIRNGLEAFAGDKQRRVLVAAPGYGPQLPVHRAIFGDADWITANNAAAAMRVPAHAGAIRWAACRNSLDREVQRVLRAAARDAITCGF